MFKNRSDSLLSVSLVVSLVVVICAGAVSSARCKVRTYVHKAVQTDFNEKRCWDDVNIKSCWGYCLSYEVSDWEFPYKISHHPVCVHGERKHASTKLRNCDPGVEPGTEIYHFVEAGDCTCKVCSSEDTSCEWLHPQLRILEEFDEATTKETE